MFSYIDNPRTKADDKKAKTKTKDKKRKEEEKVV